MKAVLKNIRISPKKANLVAGMIRGENVNSALSRLQHTPKKAAKILYKVVASAAANAENNFKQKAEKLYIKEIVVTEGPSYKRSVSISRGRMHPRKKRTSHITVQVDVTTSASEVKPKKAVKKPETDAPKTEVKAKKETITPVKTPKTK